MCRINCATRHRATQSPSTVPKSDARAKIIRHRNGGFVCLPVICHSSEAVIAEGLDFFVLNQSNSNGIQGNSLSRERNKSKGRTLIKVIFRPRKFHISNAHIRRLIKIQSRNPIKLPVRASRDILRSSFRRRSPSLT